MLGMDCGKRDAGNGLWEKGCWEWTVEKGMLEEGTVGKGMLGMDCGKRDAGNGLWEKRFGKGDEKANG